MNLVGLTAIQEIRKLPGFEQAIIAGGFVRDGILGGSFKDIDIFVPVISQDDLRKKVDNLRFEEGIPVYIDNDTGHWRRVDNKDRVLASEYSSIFYTGDDPKTRDEMYALKRRRDTLGNFSEFIYKERSEYQSRGYMGHYNVKYLKNIDVDIIGYSFDKMTDFEGNPVSFGTQLIKTFNYGIDRCYFDGTDTILSEEFEYDRRRQTATLLILETIDALPGAMAKYNRFKEKYPQFAWTTNLLEIKKDDKKEEVNNKSKHNKYAQAYGYGQVLGLGNLRAGEGAAIRPQWDGPGMDFFARPDDNNAR